MTPEKFTSHVVFEKLEQYLQVLTSENAKEKIDLDNFTFFEATYLYIKDRLNLTIPILVQEAELVGLSTEIESGTGQINSFLGNENTGHLINAINNFNSALNRIKNLPLPFAKSDFSFSKSIANFQKLVKENYDNLGAVNLQTRDELSNIQASLLLKQMEITSLEKKLVEKEAELKNVLITYNAELENFKNTANTSIEADRKKFNDNIEADRKNYKEIIEKDKNDLRTEFEFQISNSAIKSGEVMTDLSDKLNEAKKIVSIIGNVGVTGNYQNIANQHKKDANFWRWAALAFMVVMSCLLIWSIIELGSSDFNLYKSIVRIIAAAVLTYPAIYASRESTKHRNLETKNRNLELELASIGPFIEILPEETKQKIKEELVSKYFGNTNSTHIDNKTESEDVSINGLEKILKTILPYINKQV